MNSFFFILLTVLTTGFCFRIKRDTQDDSYWNDAVGDLVRGVASELLEKEGSYIDVDDFTETFGGSLLNGKIKATGGSIGNFSTLRFVNLTVSTTSDTLTVFVQVTLDQLEVAYSNFDASVRILSVSGGFRASVASNLLTAQVTLTLDDDCAASIDILEVTEFEGIDLAITGIDLVNEKFVNKLANMVVNKFTPELKPMIERELKARVAPYMSMACSYLDYD